MNNLRVLFSGLRYFLVVITLIFGLSPLMDAQGSPGMDEVRLHSGLSSGDWRQIKALTPVLLTNTTQTYFKASNTESSDSFGNSVAISGDTLVVGAYLEGGSGAAYVFTRSGDEWSQQAYLKASNAEIGDFFGLSVAISVDTLVVGAFQEDSDATGLDGDQGNNTAEYSGAAYAFTRSSGTWSQMAYLKASNTEAYDAFGYSVTLSGDMIAIGAYQEDSNATGVGGDQLNNLAEDSGAVYGIKSPWCDLFIPFISK